MNTIEVDFDVYKALTLRRAAEDVTYNDVLREVLELGSKKSVASSPDTALSGQGDWITKGVRFPVGTEFRAIYKGQTHYGKIEAGTLVVNGKRFDSPSAAAVAITGHPVNGWTFWECRLPGGSSWQMIKWRRR